MPTFKEDLNVMHSNNLIFKNVYSPPLLRKKSKNGLLVVGKHCQCMRFDSSIVSAAQPAFSLFP